ncbi:MAG: PspC domain-containing protein [Candidatus Altiarchaeota archaeon]|nr:PspC domain-containing protein [Candidatus Altiarchaeota archaeon]
MRIASVDIGNVIFSDILELLNLGLWKIFLGIAFIGYLLALIKLIFHGSHHIAKNVKKGIRKTKTTANRLYRSGKDRFLGGVCGGIAEFFDADSTIIRMLWIGFSIVWMIGIPAYLIAWIIIPRNPKHKW